MGTKDLAQVRTFYYRTIKSINKALEEAVSRGHPKEGEALEVLMVKNSGAPGEDSACEYADSHAIMVGWWRAREKAAEAKPSRRGGRGRKLCPKRVSRH